MAVAMAVVALAATDAIAQQQVKAGRQPRLFCRPVYIGAIRGIVLSTVREGFYYIPLWKCPHIQAPCMSLLVSGPVKLAIKVNHHISCTAGNFPTTIS